MYKKCHGEQLANGVTTWQTCFFFCLNDYTALATLCWRVIVQKQTTVKKKQRQLTGALLKKNKKKRVTVDDMRQIMKF